MTLRRHVSFRSTAFQTAVPEDIFAEDRCLGEDLARWLIGELRARGLEADPDPGQEDFGWSVRFRFGESDCDFLISYQPVAEGRRDQWAGVLERRASFLSSIFGGRKRGIEPAATAAIHEILVGSSKITEARWFTEREWAQKAEGQATP